MFIKLLFSICIMKLLHIKFDGLDTLLDESSITGTFFNSPKKKSELNSFVRKHEGMYLLVGKLFIPFFKMPFLETIPIHVELDSPGQRTGLKNKNPVVYCHGHDANTGEIYYLNRPGFVGSLKDRSSDAVFSKSLDLLPR